MRTPRSSARNPYDFSKSMKQADCLGELPGPLEDKFQGQELIGCASSGPESELAPPQLFLQNWAALLFQRLYIYFIGVLGKVIALLVCAVHNSEVTEFSFFGKTHVFHSPGLRRRVSQNKHMICGRIFQQFTTVSENTFRIFIHNSRVLSLVFRPVSLPPRALRLEPEADRAFCRNQFSTRGVGDSTVHSKSAPHTLLSLHVRIGRP